MRDRCHFRAARGARGRRVASRRGRRATYAWSSPAAAATMVAASGRDPAAADAGRWDDVSVAVGVWATARPCRAGTAPMGRYGHALTGARPPRAPPLAPCVGGLCWRPGRLCSGDSGGSCPRWAGRSVDASRGGASRLTPPQWALTAAAGAAGHASRRSCLSAPLWVHAGRKWVGLGVVGRCSTAAVAPVTGEESGAGL